MFIYLKSPERIEALAMIMGLCLLVYTLGQRQIRAALGAGQTHLNFDKVVQRNYLAGQVKDYA
ncbi:MAG: hypothetical protein RMY34_29505 [Aulosira sp. DedQUE10]|nr:hypothetical protein [Aulosira sp. DedQUE10]